MTNLEPTIGQRERRTQQRIVELLRKPVGQGGLGYIYLGDWTEDVQTSPIIGERLKTFLTKTQQHSDKLADRAIFEMSNLALDKTKRLYDLNRDLYEALRYGIKLREEHGENKKTIQLIDWDNPQNNDFAFAEEVTVDMGRYKKRPDIVLYVNGIALGVLELKRSSVDVSEGIRQNLDSQKKDFIQRFYGPVQLVMAGNDTQGLRYGTIETPEKYYLQWKEEREHADKPNELVTPEDGVKVLLPVKDAAGDDSHATQITQFAPRLDFDLSCVCRKDRLLEIIQDFTVFDRGVKKLCRPNQYFGVRAAQRFVGRKEGGILWHTQGSGKSLSMVWLAKWIKENVSGSRVLVITDRTELDEQIEKVFLGVGEKGIVRTSSGSDLIASLQGKLKRKNFPSEPSLICSLVHKFGHQTSSKKSNKASDQDIEKYLEELQKALPKDFKVKGDFFVFVDEAHRTQSGKLHAAMKKLIPNATFIGFTGTPLLKKDSQTSLEVFGRYIHTYKFDQAVRDEVVLDLRYEARDIDQRLGSKKKIDAYFEAKTAGLTDVARAELKKRWGTLQRVFSSQERLEQIANDIVFDMQTKPRLMDGTGNAMLVCSSIYEACRYYEIFEKTDLKNRIAIVTSYEPTAASIKGEESGEGETERLRQYAVYRRMLSQWFAEPDEDKALARIEDFETQVKERFIDEPGQMKLLIVVDKLLTGFDAPSATYLYIDKQMQDHGLFQAICRVNRLDGETKDYGYIIDYKDLFKSLKTSIKDYTEGALDGYAKEDVDGLLEDRLLKGKEDLDEALDQVKAICEPVAAPRGRKQYYAYFAAETSGDTAQLKENEPRRLAFYKHAARLVRTYAAIAGDMAEAGYTAAQIVQIKKDVVFYEKLREELKIFSGDAIDLKRYEPAMRHLLDSYVRAEASEKLSDFENKTLVQLVVENGVDALPDVLPDEIADNEEAMAETIENNVRKLIVDKNPINPKYYESMSALLDGLISKRRSAAIKYAEYLKKISELAANVFHGEGSKEYPALLQNREQKAIYDNFGQDPTRAIQIDAAIRTARQDDWKGNRMKERKVRVAIQKMLPDSTDEEIEALMNLALQQEGY